MWNDTLTVENISVLYSTNMSNKYLAEEGSKVEDEFRLLPAKI